MSNSMNKPSIPMDTDGNIFFVVGAARKAMKRAGQEDKVDDLTKRVQAAGSYAEALTIVSEYVNFD